MHTFIPIKVVRFPVSLASCPLQAAARLQPTSGLKNIRDIPTRDILLFLPVPILVSTEVLVSSFCCWFLLRSSLSTAMTNSFAVLASFPFVFLEVLGRQRGGTGGTIQLGSFSTKVSLERLPARCKTYSH